ncbi:DUF3486 family protein [Methylohalobius crimeensis]|uniref:DUF3486 family protein n=1 Tax=Methylohalobius crimeensis TaxID=244365 RepID=UPI0003B50799|nr:DUF3486 family protein [Methylohalobius crimeensis]
MARKRIFDSIPDEVLTELDERILSKQYSDLELCDWLNNQGFKVSKNTVNRYCLDLRSGFRNLLPDFPDPNRVTAPEYIRKLQRFGALLIHRRAIDAEIKHLEEELIAAWPGHEPQGKGGGR